MKHWLAAALKIVGGALALVAIASVLLMAQGSQVPPNPAVAPEPSAGKVDEAAFRRVSSRLVCQCGCGYMVLSCNHLDCPSAGFIRRTIQTSLAAGKSEDAIVAAFVAQYGPRILPEPPAKGFDLSAWVMPFAVLLLGTVLVTYILWRWKFRYRTANAGAGTAGSVEQAPQAPGSASPEREALIQKYQAQIDQELEND